jgi:hypothetical protein
VFRIGQSLQDARIARGLELSEVEQQTLIRRKYLGALEAERFDVLPGDAYVRAFLREYAEFLGLDPRPFLDQLAVQQEDPEPLPFTPPPLPARRPHGRRRLLVLGALAVVAATVSLLAWKAGGGSSPRLPLAQPETRPAQKRAAAVRQHRPAERRAAPAPNPAGPHLLLTAARGPVWLLVRVRSRQGETLFEDILAPGRSLRFGRRDLWIRIGAPPDLDIRVDGQRVTLPPSSRPQNVVVAAEGGLRPA